MPFLTRDDGTVVTPTRLIKFQLAEEGGLIQDKQAFFRTSEKGRTGKNSKFSIFGGLVGTRDGKKSVFSVRTLQEEGCSNDSQLF